MSINANDQSKKPTPPPARQPKHWPDKGGDANRGFTVPRQPPAVPSSPATPGGPGSKD